MKIYVVEYRPEWREMFEEEKHRLRAVLDTVPARIEHIGSTSVVGLAAKPIIDIMVGLPDFSALPGFRVSLQRPFCPMCIRRLLRI